MDLWQTAVRLLAGVGVTVAALAQTPPQTIPAVRSQAVAGFLGGVPPAPMAGHPYSAEQVTEHTQVLADGTRISQTSQTSMMYRDSEGRTRTERVLPPLPGGAKRARPSFIEIYDPVARCRYILNEQNHSAQKLPFPPATRAGSNVPPSVWFSSNLMPSSATSGGMVSGGMMSVIPPPAPPQASGNSDSGPKPEFKQESLGTETMEGVPAEGKRTTTVYPEGWFGNDRPVTTTFEIWTSAEISAPVLMKAADPRTGENITRLINIRLTEPDAALFQVPSDYQVSESQPMPLPPQ